jgi:hypothetical protein
MRHLHKRPLATRILKQPWPPGKPKLDIDAASGAHRRRQRNRRAPPSARARSNRVPGQRVDPRRIVPGQSRAP